MKKEAKMKYSWLLFVVASGLIMPFQTSLANGWPDKNHPNPTLSIPMAAGSIYQSSWSRNSSSRILYSADDPDTDSWSLLRPRLQGVGNVFPTYPAFQGSNGSRLKCLNYDGQHNDRPVQGDGMQNLYYFDITTTTKARFYCHLGAVSLFPENSGGAIPKTTFTYTPGDGTVTVAGNFDWNIYRNLEIKATPTSAVPVSPPTVGRHRCHITLRLSAANPRTLWLGGDNIGAVKSILASSAQSTAPTASLELTDHGAGCT